MATFPQSSSVTLEDYLDYCRNNPDIRYEYDHGQVTLLAGGKLDHAKIALNIASTLKGLMSGPCLPFTSDAVLKLSSERYVLPDVTVTCDERDMINNDYLQYPCVVFEVLSPSTEAIDRGRKFSDYQRCHSLQEYILVSSDEMLIEVFKREKEPMWTYRAYRKDEEVSLSSLGVSLRMADVYQHVTFAKM